MPSDSRIQRPVLSTILYTEGSQSDDVKPTVIVEDGKAVLVQAVKSDGLRITDKSAAGQVRTFQAGITLKQPDNHEVKDIPESWFDEKALEGAESLKREPFKGSKVYAGYDHKDTTNNVDS